MRITSAITLIGGNITIMINYSNIDTALIGGDWQVLTNLAVSIANLGAAASFIHSPNGELDQMGAALRELAEDTEKRAQDIIDGETKQYVWELIFLHKDLLAPLQLTEPKREMYKNEEDARDRFAAHVEKSRTHAKAYKLATEYDKENYFMARDAGHLAEMVSLFKVELW